ncbi:hypothetical protein [Thomasclavelia cocleata]|uniref:hypothetical protein n=1 Tax=Thomasclavelia cocleata TaxID=69824 RepID=UPI00256FDE65|nr:hypothetical protein [Thomasclavelia cocleata]
MKNYKYCNWITLILLLVSLLGCLWLLFLGNLENTYVNFWCNVLLAIFGSSLLTFITTLIGYIDEKRKTLELLFIETQNILKIIKMYDVEKNVDDKINFLLRIYEYNFYTWENCISNLGFWTDFNLKNQKKLSEIIKKLYLPINNLRQKISNKSQNFYWYIDGSGRNEEVTKSYIEEIEKCFIQKKYQYNVLFSWNYLVKDINNFLNDGYTRLLNGKERENNGED